MKRTWEAEAVIEPAHAARLIRSIAPDLAADSLVLLGQGWDNTAFLVDDTWVFRFPRRDIAADFLRHETAGLLRLSGLLPLAIPVPVYIGEPTDDWPWPFTGYRRLEGSTACRAAPEPRERLSLAAPVARFLRALHDLEVRPGDGPPDLIERTVPSRRLERTLPLFESLGHRIDVQRVEAAARDAATAKPATPPHCWCHGDLYARHLLLDDAGSLAGVIDWGDVHVGDRAGDLSIAFSFFPEGPIRRAFFDVYGELDRESEKRARAKAIHYGLVGLVYGEETGDSGMERMGRHALTCVVGEGVMEV